MLHIFAEKKVNSVQKQNEYTGSVYLKLKFRKKLRTESGVVYLLKNLHYP